ncbi:hypothetical protein M8818_002307 [Zalaria obscura]|uniref:Uncharacterized protein n=1 Tax=Zalaria obscura TaxID=2024903 RepID=A0ACC3SIF3_9PEZI
MHARYLEALLNLRMGHRLSCPLFNESKYHVLLLTVNSNVSIGLYYAPRLKVDVYTPESSTVHTCIEAEAAQTPQSSATTNQHNRLGHDAASKSLSLHSMADAPLPSALSLLS